MTDRAVSETVGFVLVFALITSTVGVVYVSGIGGLTDARDAEQVNNAERAFDVLADNMADVHRRNAPSRATEIKLAGAQLGYDEPTEMSVQVDGRSPNTVTLSPIVYTAESGSEIVYEAGAVVRTDPNGGAVMKHEPNAVFRVDDGERVAVLPLLRTNTRDSGGVGGSTTVLVRGTHAISEVMTTRTSGGHAVTVTVDTAPSRAPVWKRYFETELDEPEWNANCEIDGSDDGTVECSFEVDRLYVTSTGIDVTIN